MSLLPLPVGIGRSGYPRDPALEPLMTELPPTDATELPDPVQAPRVPTPPPVLPPIGPGPPAGLAGGCPVAGPERAMRLGAGLPCLQ
jgi:hypothetical protein